MIITEIPIEYVFNGVDKIAKRYSVRADCWLVGDGIKVVFHVRVCVGDKMGDIFREEKQTMKGKMLVKDVYSLTRRIIKFIELNKISKQPMRQQTLGGTIFIRNNIEFDYNVIQSIECLLELCDKVVICDAGSDDGTLAMMWERFGYNQKIDWVFCTPKQWEEQKGSQKLAYFTNKAIEKLDTDWNINLQADECIHESSFPWIRQAINEGKHESYLCKRINLWGDCNHFLDVPQERKPCSDVVLRLAKSKYQSAGDAESLETPECSPKYIENIRILHYGFTRDRRKMVPKIKNMQESVFGMSESDPKLKGMDLFDPFAWFSKDDLKELTEPHPKYMAKWVEERAEQYKEFWV